MNQEILDLPVARALYPEGRIEGETHTAAFVFVQRDYVVGPHVLGGWGRALDEGAQALAQLPGPLHGAAGTPEARLRADLADALVRVLASDEHKTHYLPARLYNDEWIEPDAQKIVEQLRVDFGVPWLEVVHVAADEMVLRCEWSATLRFLRGAGL